MYSNYSNRGMYNCTHFNAEAVISGEENNNYATRNSRLQIIFCNSN